jgi:B12-binding domain/radical SAM domain protein
MSPVSLVLNFHKLARVALKVIVGALESDARTRDIPVEFVDHRASLTDAIERELKRSRTVVVAWSFYSPQFTGIARDLARIKRHFSDPRVIHLAGGVHATTEPEQTLRAGFDFAAVGEGEHVIIDFMDRLQRGEDVRTAPGIASLDGGRVVRNGRGALVDLNAFPPFAVAHRKFGPIEVTRGCIYGCKFCATPFLNKARFRHRTIENVCRYVRVMKENGLRDYRFITPTSLSYGSADESVNLKAVEELLVRVRSIIGRHRRLYYGTFPSEVRPEHVTPEALAVLKKYVDNDNLIIGGQSGSENILRASHRGHDVEAIERATRYAREAGFEVNVDFLFNLPGESEGDVAASLALARRLTELGVRIHAHTFMPLPGTPYRDAPPGRLAPESMTELERLSSERRLYGQWRRQIRFAKEIAERRVVR